MRDYAGTMSPTTETRSLGFTAQEMPSSQQQQVAGANGDTEQFRAPPQFGGDILENMGQGVYCLDVQGRLVYVNKYSERFFGWHRQEVLGVDATKIMAAPGYKHIGYKVVERLAEKKSWTGQFPLVRRNGEVVWTIITATPILNEQNDLVATCCTFMELKRFLPNYGEGPALPSNVGFGSAPIYVTETGGSPKPIAADPSPMEHPAGQLTGQSQAEGGGLWGFLKALWGTLWGSAPAGSPLPAGAPSSDPYFQREIDALRKPKPPSPRSKKEGPKQPLSREASGIEGASERRERSAWAERVDFTQMRQQYHKMRTDMEDRRGRPPQGGLEKGFGSGEGLARSGSKGRVWGSGDSIGSRSRGGSRENLRGDRSGSPVAGRFREGSAGSSRGHFTGGAREGVRGSGKGLERWSSQGAAATPSLGIPPRSQIQRQSSGVSSQGGSSLDSVGADIAVGGWLNRANSDLEQEGGSNAFKGHDRDRTRAQRVAWDLSGTHTKLARSESSEALFEQGGWHPLQSLRWKVGGQHPSRQGSSNVGSEATEDEFHSLEEGDGTWRLDVDAVEEEDLSEAETFAAAELTENDKGAFGSAILNHEPGDGGYEEVQGLLRKSSSEKSSDSEGVVRIKGGAGLEEQPAEPRGPSRASELDVVLDTGPAIGKGADTGRSTGTAQETGSMQSRTGATAEMDSPPFEFLKGSPEQARLGQTEGVPPGSSSPLQLGENVPSSSGPDLRNALRGVASDDPGSEPALAAGGPLPEGFGSWDLDSVQSEVDEVVAEVAAGQRAADNATAPSAETTSANRQQSEVVGKSAAKVIAGQQAEDALKRLAAHTADLSAKRQQPETMEERVMSLRGGSLGAVDRSTSPDEVRRKDLKQQPGGEQEIGARHGGLPSVASSQGFVDTAQLGELPGTSPMSIFLHSPTIMPESPAEPERTDCVPQSKQRLSKDQSGLGKAKTVSLSARAEECTSKEGRSAEASKKQLSNGNGAAKVEGPGGATSSRGRSEVLGTLEWSIPWEEVTLGKEIGRGARGAVYHSIWQGSDVAVKVFPVEDVSMAMVEEFRKEVGIMLRARHPNVVLFMGAITTPPNFAIITEVLPRGSLFRLLHGKSPQTKREPPSESRRMRMALDVAKGMNYLHSCSPPIVHRDLKSPNILVDRDWTAKVGDFGMSRLKHATYVSAMTGVGIPEWMAPEVLRSEPSGEKCDVYSFGVILWELVTMQRPWSGMKTGQIIGAVAFQDQRLPIPDTVAANLASLIRGCWKRDPRERPTFQEIVIELKTVVKATASRHEVAH